MSEWNALTPTERVQLGGPAVGKNWSLLSNEEQDKRLDEARRHIARKRKSKGIERVIETPSQKISRKEAERAERKAERERMRKGIITRASGGSVKGRPAKKSAENS